MNIDEAHPTNLGQEGMGGLFRNQEGQWLLGYLQPLPNTTPLEAKLRALLRGLQFVVNHQLAPLEINTDASEVIIMMQQGDLRYGTLLSECRLLMEQLQEVELMHIYKEENKVVDIMAKEGAQQESLHTTIVFMEPPIFVKRQVEADRVRTSYIRYVSHCKFFGPGYG